jgi:hypothetical protein
MPTSSSPEAGGRGSCRAAPTSDTGSAGASTSPESPFSGAGFQRSGATFASAWGTTRPASAPGLADGDPHAGAVAPGYLHAAPSCLWITAESRHEPKHGDVLLCCSVTFLRYRVMDPGFERGGEISRRTVLRIADGAPRPGPRGMPTFTLGNGGAPHPVPSRSACGPDTIFQLCFKFDRPVSVPPGRWQLTEREMGTEPFLSASGERLATALPWMLDNQV